MLNILGATAFTALILLSGDNMLLYCYCTCMYWSEALPLYRYCRAIICCSIAIVLACTGRRLYRYSQQNISFVWHWDGVALLSYPGLLVDPEFKKEAEVFSGDASEKDINSAGEKAFSCLYGGHSGEG